MIKVYLGGEGANELGTRGQRPPGDDPGVIETLLRRVRPDGWRVDGAIAWKAIRKYQAGAAARYPTHGENYNVLRLLLLAYEQACELVVFVRDVDRDEERAEMVTRPLQESAASRFAEDHGYELRRCRRHGHRLRTRCGDERAEPWLSPAILARRCASAAGLRTAQ